MNIFRKNGIREINFQLEKDAILTLQKDWTNFANKEIEEYPSEKFKNRGIVMCAGGIKYFTCAWIAIQVLRVKGCKLMIELWHKELEIPETCINEITKFNVVCKNFSDYTDEKTSGWSLKPLSILHSSFKEIIYLDADNICLKDPEILFESKDYITTGALFWPDHWETSADNPIWKIMKVKFNRTKEQESGQMVIDKEKSWRALNLCCYLNKKKNIYHKLLLGDKDTFRFSWLSINLPFKIVDGEPGTCGYFDQNNDFMGHTMVQYFNSKPFFLHRNLIKWDITRNGEFVWKNIKVFKEDAKRKDYFIDYSQENHHTYVDIKGDIEVLNFEKEIGDIEIICQNFLINLRNRPFYKDCLIDVYLQNNRFINMKI